MKIQKIDSFKGNGTYIALVICLIVFSVFCRLIPHPPNFAPVAAIAIFGGTLLPRRWALIIPILVMAISDTIIGLYPMFFFTWGAFLLIGLLSNKMIKQVKPTLVVSASLIASIMFYLISNFGVWLAGNLYPMTLPGLIDCYFRAIPFLRNTMLGDLVFTGMLFGLYALAYVVVSSRRTAPKTT